MKKTTLLSLLLVTCGLTNAQNLQISGGNDFSAAIFDNQVVHVWGANNSGQLGVDSTDVKVSVNYRNLPASVTRGNISNTKTLSMGQLPAIKQVDAGSGAHVLGVSCNNQVWAWGDNTNGQLGRGTFGSSSTPANYIPSRVLAGAQDASKNNSTADPQNIYLDNVSYISGGNNTSFAIEAGTGKVLAWGQNEYGQLGDGTGVDKLTPVYVLMSAGTPLTNIIQVEAGNNSTYALDANGNVWSWGDNQSYALGRPTGTAVVNTSGSPYAAQVVATVPLCNGYSCATNGFLTNIVQISGGYAHCLALDAKGNVWSFGGDWGAGQLGRGGGAVFQNYAARVVNPGVTTYPSAESSYLGSGDDGKAIYVAAGLASSAVVMQSGKVVTFGANGLYGTGNVSTQLGTITCPNPSGVISSGTLGTGSCYTSICSNTAYQTYTPVYVLYNANKYLTGITQISDGDAWFFATTASGEVFSWGWNKRGELGKGNYSDNCYATQMTLPTGLKLSPLCPSKPNLPADFSSCPIFTSRLDPKVNQNYFNSYKYSWYYRTGSSSVWTTLFANSDSATLKVNKLGEYKVSISDTRSFISTACGPCTVVSDSIIISEALNPYTVKGCWFGNEGQFVITTPKNSKIKWYSSYSGGNALNPNDSLNVFIADSTQAPKIKTCGAGVRGLYAEDLTIKKGVLMPATTVSMAQSVTGCTSLVNEYDLKGERFLTRITVTQTVKITSASFIHNANSGNASIKIYNDNYGARGTLIYTSPSKAVSGTGPIIYDVAMNYTLPAGSYWIGTASEAELKRFNCNFGAAISDSLSPHIMTTDKGITDGYNTLGKGTVFNIKFEMENNGYTCPRILACMPSDVCDLSMPGLVRDINGIRTTELTNNIGYFPIQNNQTNLELKCFGRYMKITYINHSLTNVNGNNFTPINSNITEQDWDVDISYNIFVDYSPNYELGTDKANLIINTGRTPLQISRLLSRTILGNQAKPKIFGKNVIISKNDMSPSFVDSTNFGVGLVGSTIYKTYKIKNIGEKNVALDYKIAPITITGSSFKLISSPNSPLKAGDSTTFVIAFTPTTTNLEIDTVTITSPDPYQINGVKGSYSFAIQGQGSLVTDFSDISLESQINITPNPNTGKFTASWFVGIPVTELLVHNTLGQEIFRTNSSNGSSLDLDLGNVPKGIYMVTLKTHESKIVKRIIVE